jgi:1,4-alpha-glucan branching enzyme
MLYKMPGDEWQRFANLRLLYTYMFSHPGKKLLFMGAEFAQGEEWDSTDVLDWYVREYPLHQGIEHLVRDLNLLYRNDPVLHTYDFDDRGFEWVDCHDGHNSVLVYLRKAGDDFLVVALNYTPVPRQNHRIGVPLPGVYQEVMNSDATTYGGSGIGNGARILQTDDRPWMNQSYSIDVCLPPLAGIILKRLPAVEAADDGIGASLSEANE